MRYERVLPRVRVYVESERKKKTPRLWPGVVARELKLPQPVINQCFAVLVQDRALEPRKALDPKRFPGSSGHAGYYEVRNITPEYRPLRIEREEPKKRKVKWNTSARHVLAKIRVGKPWVIERWYPEDSRWYMYMEARTPAQHPAILGEKPIPPEEQSKLPRAVIAKWHFEDEEAIKKCGQLRRQYPKDTFRTRDTRNGDYVLGDILL